MAFPLSQLHSIQRTLVVASPAEVGEQPPLAETLKKAAWKATGGGLAGAAAMFVNVGTLMWMRTTVNFQYRYGMSTIEAIKHLYNDGGRGLSGIRRFYQGVGPALLQGPLSRFGDTAANAGMLAIWDSYDVTRNAPNAAKTVTASAAAASFRVLLMPIDACKTILQVEGGTGLTKLGARQLIFTNHLSVHLHSAAGIHSISLRAHPAWHDDDAGAKIRSGGIGVLWHGSIGAMSATFVGHYPWFLTNNVRAEPVSPLLITRRLIFCTLLWSGAQRFFA